MESTPCIRAAQAPPAELTALSFYGTTRRCRRSSVGPAAHRASQPDVTILAGSDNPDRVERASSVGRQ